jgi:D-3-phosphoglycerate dehydrogenase
MKIVITEPLHMADEVRRCLASHGKVVCGPFDDTALAAELSDCEVLIVRLGRYIGADLMAIAPQLRFIVTATTGLDHIDLNAARMRGVRVVSLRDCMGAISDISATAEHTFGLVLALLRNTIPAANHVLDGGFDRNRFFGSQLKGKRLGILGYGRIGRLVARYADAFGMGVAACDRMTEKVTAPAALIGFEELLETSDLVSIHVAADPENRHLIDKAAIARLRPGAFVINTARGSIVDEAALAEAVLSGRLAGVAVDVLDGEERANIASSPLLAAARGGHNVLITPHIGGATIEAIARTEAAVVAVLATALGSEALAR